MRLVLDTDVVLSGLRSATGASRLLLCGVVEGAFRPLITTATILEYEDVLKRAESLAATMLAPTEVDDFLGDFLLLAEHVAVPRRVRPSVRDPDDEMFVEALVHGHGAAIVTFNRRDYLDADDTLASKGQATVRTLRPGEVLRRLAWRPRATTLFRYQRS